MKKTKYNQGGLSARGSNEEGLNLSYNSPKVSAYRAAISGRTEIGSRKRGESRGVVISGMSSELIPTSGINNHNVSHGSDERKESENAPMSTVAED